MNREADYWPHAPMHSLSEQGVYMVTAGTYQKQHFLNAPDKLTLFRDLLFSFAAEFGWQLQAWAIMANHYHFVAVSPASAESLRRFIGKLHEYNAKKLNRIDQAPGRKVWHNYWDSHITHQTSYYARLRYVHRNPEHHGIIDQAANYRWCSQAWLEHHADRAFVNTLAKFKTDRISVRDDF
ncbi:hypothetical protein PDESU_01516 [Pontiella desulfatans]|uniref:Transposase IS200-like domain-containing protein n=1 Tax=Pontiella desulfatans TaxID=2750659 RepID=A0A6C2TZ78_PONDE|nr:transposase [Pontiella desulfatans]VGO12962.1 hypothetical protein PDESU_01516 [Pontiella desulfatans]